MEGHCSLTAGMWSSNLPGITNAPIDHWLDRRAFNPEKADRNRLGVCPRSETGHHGGLRNRKWGFEFLRGLQRLQCRRTVRFHKPDSRDQHSMELPFRGEGLLVSRMSGGHESAGSTPAIPTTSACRPVEGCRLDMAEIASSSLATRTGASSSGRAEALQASDGCSIHPAPTTCSRVPLDEAARLSTE